MKGKDSRVKITFEMELSKEEEVQLRENSLERILNNAVAVCHGGGDKGVLELDIDELKPIIRRVWCNAQEALFKAAM